MTGKVSTIVKSLSRFINHLDIQKKRIVKTNFHFQNSLPNLPDVVEAVEAVVFLVI